MVLEEKSFISLGSQRWNDKPTFSLPEPRGKCDEANMSCCLFSINAGSVKVRKMLNLAWTSALTQPPSSMKSQKPSSAAVFPWYEILLPVIHDSADFQIKMWKRVPCCWRHPSIYSDWSQWHPVADLSVNGQSAHRGIWTARSDLSCSNTGWHNSSSKHQGTTQFENGGITSVRQSDIYAVDSFIVRLLPVNYVVRHTSMSNSCSNYLFRAGPDSQQWALFYRQSWLLLDLTGHIEE